MGVELFIVLAGAVAVAGFARWRGWPAPLLVTGAALVVSMLPFIPEISVDGHLLLNLTLPPLLYSAALDSSFISFKRSLPHIRRLGIGLVLVTAVIVGVVAWLIMPELTFAGALLLGAIVGPPDAVSAAAIGRKLGLPRRVMNVMSGESLINDATSLTLVRVFAAIVAGATVTVWQGIWEFVLAVLVGVAFGLVAGYLLHWLRMISSDTIVSATFGLLIPFGVYALAEEFHGSGVLAVVAMGLYVGYNAPKTNYSTRQHDEPLWKSVDFLLESFVFAYIGLQLPGVLAELFGSHGSTIVWLSIAVLLTVIAIRPVFVFASYAWGQMWQKWRLLRFKHAREELRKHPDARRARAVRARLERVKGAKGGPEPTKEALRRRLLEPPLSRRERVVISWAGMRGVVTLAMAAALPDLTEHEMPYGNVEAVIAVAFVVTVGTLLLQGLTLPWLIRTLGVSADEERANDLREVERVRRISKDAGLEFLRKRQEKWVSEYGEEARDQFNNFSRGLLRVQRDTVRAEREAETEEIEIGELEKIARKQEKLYAHRAAAKEFEELSRGWIEVRRQVLMEQCRVGNVSEEVMRDLFVAMDAEELALDTRTRFREE
ncbi:cation:proton antiporter [Microbacterium halophytorum]|uniref:cation:proton antiporter n=1 Tax=Microbacterium halophytorum TaxID=2067568 RepID=UPI000CFD33DB|nr:sodium:proton antiporter [Microbacterium halophytorum]